MAATPLPNENGWYLNFKNLFDPCCFEYLRFLNELSKRPPLGLILKDRHSSFKWAQVEVTGSIRSKATVSQSYVFFLRKTDKTHTFLKAYNS